MNCKIYKKINKKIGLCFKIYVNNNKIKWKKTWKHFKQILNCVKQALSSNWLFVFLRQIKYKNVNKRLKKVKNF